MNYLWAGMILLGIIYGLFTGNLEEVTQAAVSSAKEAVNLCIGLAGVTALWVGLMKIAENAGLVEQLTGKIRPVLRFLFPEVKKGSKAEYYIALNMIANVLGISWGSTPAGLMAMKELDAQNQEECRKYGEAVIEHRGRYTASSSMCTFLIINISSLQLIPINMIAYRSQYGSVNPAAVVGPAIAATAVSTFAGVIFCKVMDMKKRKDF